MYTNIKRIREIAKMDSVEFNPNVSGTEAEWKELAQS